MSLEIQSRRKLYLAIRTQAHRSPDRSIDHTKLPDIRFGESGAWLDRTRGSRQSARERNRRVSKVRAIEDVIDLRLEFDVYALRYSEPFLQRQIELVKHRSLKKVSREISVRSGCRRCERCRVQEAKAT